MRITVHLCVFPRFIPLFQFSPFHSVSVPPDWDEATQITIKVLLPTMTLVTCNFHAKTCLLLNSPSSFPFFSALHSHLPANPVFLFLILRVTLKLGCPFPISLQDDPRFILTYQPTPSSSSYVPHLNLVKPIDREGVDIADPADDLMTPITFGLKCAVVEGNYEVSWVKGCTVD